MRVHSVTNEIMIGLDASSKLIAEGISSACCATRAAAQHGPFWKATPRISDAAPRSISTSYWKVSEGAA
jgi:hypothetical protein